MADADELAARKCKPCEGGVTALAPDAVPAFMAALHPDWQLAADGRSIARTFEFLNFYRTIAFVNAVAWVANMEDHHPDLEVGYSRCLVRWWTHAASGLTENDFICAARVDRLEK